MDPGHTIEGQEPFRPRYDRKKESRRNVSCCFGSGWAEPSTSADRAPNARTDRDTGNEISDSPLQIVVRQPDQEGEQRLHIGLGLRKKEGKDGSGLVSSGGRSKGAADRARPSAAADVYGTHSLPRVIREVLDVSGRADGVGCVLLVPDGPLSESLERGRHAPVG